MTCPLSKQVHEGLKKITKANNVTAQAAFRSHTKRSFGPSKHQLTPAPGSFLIEGNAASTERELISGTYNLDSTGSRTTGPAYQSNFRSTSKRDAFGSQPGIKVRTRILMQCNTSNGIVVAAWSSGLSTVRETDGRTVSAAIPVRQHRVSRSRSDLSLPYRRHHFLTISSPAAPLAPEAPMPGPGAYELPTFLPTDKKYMSSAAFVSNTSRWVIDTTTAEKQPGPASYTPFAPAKQSFNFNFERKWI